MKKNKKIIIGIIIITILLLTLLGLTYAYYRTRVIGNKNPNSISVTATKLEIVYNDGDGSIIGNNKILKPDNDNPIGTKIFTVTNNGDEVVEDYAVIVENLAVKYYGGTNVGQVTNLVNGEDGNPDMKLVITCKSYKNYTTSKEEVGTCNGMDGYLPEKSDILLTNTIDEGITHEYTSTLTYLEDGTNQSDDMNKIISGKFNIIDTKSTIDITGTVANYNPGDIVTINSEYKESVIYPDGTYKLMGVKPDIHTLKVVGSTTTEIGKVSIKSGTDANTEGMITYNGTTIPEITITDNSKILTINLSNKVQVVALSSTKLADTIIFNAKKVEAQNETNRTKYSTTYLTTPAEEASSINERLLLETEDNYTLTTGKKSYYFRGNVEDNYVTFSNMCWRIVRVQGDGSIKLILESKTPCSESMTSNFSIGSANWGYKIENSKYTIGDYKDSTNINSMKNLLTSWFNETDKSGKRLNITEKAESLLKTEEWCLGNTTNAYAYYSPYELLEFKANEHHIEGTWFYYETRRNLSGVGVTPNATLKCNGETDLSKIGALTADEVVFAGGIISGSCNDFYLENNYYQSWWTLSHSIFYNNFDRAIRVSVGYIDDRDVSLETGVRPAVSLKSSVVLLEGEGTLENPYIIYEG